MIKKILPILLISSCSYISYGQLPELIVQSVRGAPDIAITDNFLEQQQYSFAKFKMGKSVRLKAIPLYGFLKIEKRFTPSMERLLKRSACLMILKY